MKGSGFLLTLLLSVFFVAQARAQEVNEPVTVTNVDPATQSRTPRLVIHETTLPAKPTPTVEPTKGLTQNPAKAAATNAPTGQTAWKDAASAVKPTGVVTTSGNNPAGVLAKPILIPTSSTVQILTEDVETTGNPYYDQLVKQSAARNGVDPSLVFALMKQESGFHSNAVSYKGASGLMQLMPGTARRFGVQNIFDPVQNIEGGTKYLRFLLDMFNGDVKLALAGYNAGENAVVNYGYQVPPYRETQNYVKNISAKYTRNKTTVKTTSKTTPSQPVAPEAMNAKGRLSNNY